MTLKNFRAFEERTFTFHPEFNVIIGANAAGKTAVLEALAVAAGSWLLGIKGKDSRHIRPEDVRLDVRWIDESPEFRPQYPVHVEAQGSVLGTTTRWRRSLLGPGGRTTRVDAASIKRLAEKAEKAVNRFEQVTLPLLSFYGTGRLWLEPKDMRGDAITSTEPVSPLDAYLTSVDPRSSPRDLVRWLLKQEWARFQRRSESGVYNAVKQAILGCLEGGTDIYFDARSQSVLVCIEGRGWQPFSQLSDGQRNIFALVGDLARRAAVLNPHLGDRVLAETPGVVLIDELDLHLHPNWQRRIVDDLRRTFPSVQFIATSHSPFIVQSLRAEELRSLDTEPIPQTDNLTLETIAENLMGVEETSVGGRYLRMKNDAMDYLLTLEEAAKAPEEKLAEYKQRLADRLAPYADNPAFQAILELERVGRIGS